MKLGDCISAGKLNFIGQLKNYYGISYRKLEKYTISMLTELVYQKTEQERLPIIFAIDTYNVPWSLYYQQMHFKHFLIVYGMEKKSFLCIDPIAQSPFYTLSFTGEVIQHLSNILTVHRHEQQIPYEKAVRKSLCSISVEQMHRGLTRFKKALLSIENIDDHINLKGNNLWLCPFGHTLFFRLPGYRTLYSEYLQRLTEMKVIGQSSDAVRELNEAANLWLSLYKNLMRLYYTNSYSLNKKTLIPILDNIIEKEQLAGLQILKFLV